MRLEIKKICFLQFSKNFCRGDVCLLGFLRFVFDCLMNGFSAAAGGVYHSPYQNMTARHGANALLIFVISAFVIIKKFGVDFEGYPKSAWSVPISILVSASISIAYFFVVYILK